MEDIVADATGSGFETDSCIVIAKIAEFSSETACASGESAVLEDYSVDSDFFRKTFRLEVHPNVKDSGQEGSVWLYLECISPVVFQAFSYFEFSCTVGVIDAHGSKRFLRSFTFPYDPNWRAYSGVLFTNFDVGPYILRRTLLDDTPDLLPEDCLTLHVDVHLKTISALSDEDDLKVGDIVEFAFLRKASGDEDDFLLSLDSKLADRLREESEYFRAISNAPLREGVARYMKVPKQEVPCFENICYLVMGIKTITVPSLSHVCEMYLVADKYTIPVAVQICGRMLDSFLSRARTDRDISDHVGENVISVWQLGEFRDNTRLKEAADTILESMNEVVEKTVRPPEGDGNDRETGKGVEAAEERGIPSAPLPAAAVRDIYYLRSMDTVQKWKEVGIEKTIRIPKQIVETEWKVIPLESLGTSCFVLSRDVNYEESDIQKPEFDFYQ